MAYDNLVDFTNDIRIMMPEISDAKVAVSYEKYLHGRNVGPFKIGILEHINPLIPQLGTIFDSVPGVLCTGTGWTIEINDSYILGGIHSHANFTLVAHNRWLKPSGANAALQGRTAGVAKGANQLDYVADAMMTDPYGTLKVTQRELLALNIFGYSRQDNSPVFRCTNHRLADQASFPLYLCEVNELSDAIASVF